MNKINDIKRLREETGGNFGIEFCKNTYEECGCDVEAAKTKILSMLETEKKDELTPQEMAELEKYKVRAEKRANSKSKSEKSAKQKYSLVMRIFSLLFFLAFVGSLIAQIVDKNAGIVELIIISGVLSVFLFIISVAVLNMTDKEFSEATSHTNAESIVYLHYDNEAIQCPHCGSTDILLKEKKFSKTKAFIGMTAFGVKGAVFGIPSHKKVKCRCADCGHEFEAVRR